jgi:hypothetical protein
VTGNLATESRIGRRPFDNGTVESWNVCSPNDRIGSERQCTARIRRKCRRWKRGPRPKNRHGGPPRGACPASWDAGALSQAPWPCRVMAGPPGAVAPGRLSALRPPLIREVPRSQPGRSAPRERDWLFEIVRQEFFVGWVEFLRDPTSRGIRDRWVSQALDPTYAHREIRGGRTSLTGRSGTSR